MFIVVGDEGFGGSTTSNSVHHRSLNLSEVTALEILAEVGDNLGPSPEDFTRSVIHDEIEVTLAETQLFILETVVLGRNGMQARCQENNLSSEDRKFTIVTVLRVSATWETDDTHNITSTKQLMLLLEGLSSRKLCLAHYLDLNTLCADIVEVQLVAGRALSVDTATNANGDIGSLFALLEALIFLKELAEVGVNLEFVRVGVRLLGFAQLVDFLAANLEVLLELHIN